MKEVICMQKKSGQCSTEEVQNFIVLYEQGKTIKEISALTQRCSRTISTILKQKGKILPASNQKHLIRLQKNKEKIINLYLSGMSIAQISKKLHHGTAGIRKTLFAANIQIRQGINSSFFLSNEELEKCVNLYNEGQSLKSICKERHHDLTTLSKLFKERNITIRDNSYYKSCEVNETYFDKIDSEEKAYFLGLLFADGYTNENNSKVQISLKIEDGYLVCALKNAIHCSNQIEYVPSKDRRHLGFGISSPQMRLAFTNEHMARVLASYGMKDKNYFPDCVPTELRHHFIRGVFDGDGCVWNGNRSPSEGLFYILAKQNFCETIKEIFEHNGCPNMQLTCRKNIWQVRKSSNKMCMFNAFACMYQGAKIYMHRKHSIWKEWLTDNELCTSSFSHIL